MISCDVLRREMYEAAARSVNTVDLEFLPKGLHDIGCQGMRDRLQQALDNVQGPYDAVLLGYGLCNMGVDGIITKRHCVVITRAHDCITLFLGSRKRFQDYFEQNPGTYYATSGWLERTGQVESELSQMSIQHTTGMDMSLEDLTRNYGEDNARYLYDTLVQNTRHYKKLTYIPMGIEPDNRFEKASRKKAEEKGWTFETLGGDLNLIQRLVDGDWATDDFVVVPTGHRISVSYDDGILKSLPI